MLWVRVPPGPLTAHPKTSEVFKTSEVCQTYPGGPARSGRHSLKVEIVGSNPIQGTDGHPRSVVAARDRAKVEGEVRLLTGILAARPIDGGYGVVAACDPVTVAVPDRNRLSTPCRKTPVQLDRSSTPLVKGRVRVRVPPLALDLLLARPSGGDRGSEPRSSWLDTSTGCSEMPAMLDGPGTALVTRKKWVRVPPPALDS